MNQLGLPKLEGRRNQQPITLTYKAGHERSPLNTMLQKTSKAHECETREAIHDFLPPYRETNYVIKALSYTGSVAWNVLQMQFKKVICREMTDKRHKPISMLFVLIRELVSCIVLRLYNYIKGCAMKIFFPLHS